MPHRDADIFVRAVDSLPEVEAVADEALPVDGIPWDAPDFRWEDSRDFVALDHSRDAPEDVLPEDHFRADPEDMNSSIEYLVVFIDCFILTVYAMLVNTASLTFSIIAYFFMEVLYMNEKRGALAVHAENIFPIIRQWLYSEKDIFIRELVSNAADALSKRRMLMQTGDIPSDEEDGRIDLLLDSKEGTLTIRDNGIGMSSEEIDRYINQIAYSGLLDFVKKYHGEEASRNVIGHFGLGFYSAFMVADKVEIESLSALESSVPAHWESEEGSEYLLREGSKNSVGTDVILHLNEEARKEYTVEKIRELLHRYVLFLPWPIFFQDEQVNIPDPIWEKDLKSIPEEEIIAFYHKVFPNIEDPLFWLPLNLDYPFRLKGVLFFPEEKDLFRSPEGRLNVYSRRIFVSDAMREMLPDYLFLLQGCLDCPDLPLNVSRSYLQEDRQVRSLSAYISRKTGEALQELFDEEPERFQELWPQLERFIKIGAMQDERFASKAQHVFLLKTEDNTYEAWENLSEGIHYYRDQSSAQDLFAERLRNEGKTIYVFDGALDLQWISYLEYISQGKKRFLRVDSEPEDSVELNDEHDDQAVFMQIADFIACRSERRALGEEAAPVLIVENEHQRRVDQMKRYLESQGLSPNKLMGNEQGGKKLILNTDHPLIAVYDKKEGKEKLDLARYLYYLALLTRGELKGKAYQDFIAQNVQLWEEK